MLETGQVVMNFSKRKSLYYYMIFKGGQNIDVALRDQATGVCCQNRPDFEEATWD